jgi:hypothetical protein
MIDSAMSHIGFRCVVRDSERRHGNGRTAHDVDAE